MITVKKLCECERKSSIAKFKYPFTNSNFASKFLVLSQSGMMKEVKKDLTGCYRRGRSSEYKGISAGA